MEPLSHIALERRAKREVPRLLHEWTGLDFESVSPGDREKTSDFLLVAPGLTFDVIVKSDASLVALSDVATSQDADAVSKQTTKRRRLVVVPYMSETGAEKLSKVGINWIDLSGNASVRHEDDPRLFISIHGRPTRFKRRGRPKNLFAPKSSRLTRYLLLHPGQAFRQRDLAEATNIDEGHVSRLVRRLEDEDLLSRTGDGGVYPRDYDLLLDAWAEGNAYRHEQLSGHIAGRSGEEVTRRLVHVLEDKKIPYAATGLCAAWAYTKYSGFRSTTLFISHQTDESALELIGFRRDSAAPNVTILFPDDVGVFAGQKSVENVMCVAPVQVYVDLHHETERAEEFAQALRKKCIRWDVATSSADGRK